MKSAVIDWLPLEINAFPEALNFLSSMLSRESPSIRMSFSDKSSIEDLLDICFISKNINVFDRKKHQEKNPDFFCSKIQFILNLI